jgi:tetratricopeptide (TPR) repeat protein
MASKTTPSKSAKAESGGASALRAETERLIAKEKYKDAVKQAKLCFKEQATPDNHRLLERAYFLRARQLLQQGMRSSAVEVVQHLIDFGVTESDSPEELVRLLAGLGFEKAALSIQERLGVAGLKEQVTQTVADQLVLHPDRSVTASPDLVQEARLVRRAIEALQAGDEAGALGMLRDLPRSSPMSEWKLFVRGLAAFERGDVDEAKTNWDRLGQGRAPAAIAGRLRQIADETPGAPAPNLEAMERIAFGEPILDRLRQLASLVAGHDWDRALPLLGSLRPILHRIDPKLPERLTRLLIGSIIKAVQDMGWEAAQSLVERFCRSAQPPAIDPRWNRLLAMVWDGPQAEPAGAIHYWSEYIHDLAKLDAFSPAERDLARAMIWNRIADLHHDELDTLLDDQGGPPGLDRFLGGPAKKTRRESREVAAARKAVIGALENSLALAPGHLGTYRQLVAIHDEWEDDAGLEAAAGRLLSKFPEDVETLQLLARHHHDRKDPRAAMPYVAEARRLKPLDEALRILEWKTHIGLARTYALEKKWNEGRTEFALADALLPADRKDFNDPVRKAMLEYKAGQAEAGDHLVEQARARVGDPGPLWLSLLIESIRFKMPKTKCDEYARLWDAELKKKHRSEMAGGMAGLMASFLHADLEYTGRAGHIKKVVDYLRKSTSLKYRREDIERVVEFLGELMPKERALFKKMVKAGIKQHPDSVLLHMSAAGLEMMDTGMSALFGAGRLTGARRHLEMALKLAEASTDPKITALLPAIRERFSMLVEVEHAMDHFGSPFGGLPLGLGADFDDMFDDEEFDDVLDAEDDLEDDDDAPSTLDFVPPPGPARRPGPKKPRRGRPKKK